MNIVLNGDSSTGHETFPPTTVIASSSVTINGVTVVLDGDSCEPHTNSVGVTHTPTIIASSAVTINGKKVALDGDALSCGDAIIASSAVDVS